VTPTSEQQAIFEYAKTGKGHLIVEALAGAGKSTTALECVKYLPQKSVLFTAFNRRIADELVERMPQAPRGSVFKAMTFHAMGLKIVSSQKVWPKFEVNAQATEKLVNETIEHHADRVGFAVRRAAVKLLRQVKEMTTAKHALVGPTTALGHTYDLFAKLSPDEIPQCVRIVQAAYLRGHEQITQRTEIDFVDMVWLPTVLGLVPPSRYQVVVVDEAQDLSFPQFELIKSLVAPGGRLFAIGDRNQELYGWRGAAGDQVWRQLKEMGAQSMPLTTTFRCGQAIVAEAQKLVPALRARPDAPEGRVRSLPFVKVPDELKDWSISTFVLSRNNADLLHTALALWQEQIEFQLVAGQEIIQPLVEIVDRLDKSTPERFTASLTTWYTVEMKKAEAAHASAWADRVEQQFAILTIMPGYVEPRKITAVLKSLLEPKVTAISLSTVHKAKGLEADRVYLLKQTFARYQEWRREPPDQEELNCEYVAVTRARVDLIWVDLPNKLDAFNRVTARRQLEPKAG